MRIQASELKPGDRIRYSRVVTVERVRMNGAVVDVSAPRPSGGIVHFALSTLGDGWLDTGLYLLERMLPPEPTRGSVVRESASGRVWVRDDVVGSKPWRTTNSESRSWGDLARQPLDILHEEQA